MKSNSKKTILKITDADLASVGIKSDFIQYRTKLLEAVKAKEVTNDKVCLLKYLLDKCPEVKKSAQATAGNNRISEDTIHTILHLYHDKGYNVDMIAKEFPGVSKTSIRKYIIRDAAGTLEENVGKFYYTEATQQFIKFYDENIRGIKQQEFADEMGHGKTPDSRARMIRSYLNGDSEIPKDVINKLYVNYSVSIGKDPSLKVAPLIDMKAVKDECADSIMSFKEFEQYINQIQQTMEFGENVYKASCRTIELAAAPNCVSTAVELLTLLCKDEEGYIAEWLIEHSEYENLTIDLQNGDKIAFETVKDLWDVINHTPRVISSNS